MDNKWETTDRVAQCNLIDQLASNLVSTQPRECTVNDIVEWWLGEGSEKPLPTWWTDHDTRYLTQRVALHLHIEE